MSSMRLRRFLGGVLVGTKGGVSMLAAGGASTLIGATALAVDVGSLYLAKRELQGAADAAALAAVSRRDNPGAGAALAIQVNSPDARVTALVAGGYDRNPDTAWDARFVPGAGDDAVRVTIERQSPLFFARIFTREWTTTISATATAARSDMAAFWIGSRLAAVNEGVANALLSALTGSHVSLTLMDYQAMAQAEVVPLRGSVDSRIRTVQYDPLQVYRLEAFVGYQIELVFAEGERFAGQGSGDVEGIAFGAHDNHVIVKPRAEQVGTNLVIYTNRRAYRFDYVVHGHAPNPRIDEVIYTVIFTYPPDASRATE